MRPKILLSRSRGFALIVTTLILVVLGALSSYVAYLTASQAMASAYDVQGAQATQAARAGIEWATFDALRNGTVCPSQNNLALTGITLSQFRVTVTCTPSSFTEDGQLINIRNLTATACNRANCPDADPPQGYVERQITAAVSSF